MVRQQDFVYSLDAAGPQSKRAVSYGCDPGVGNDRPRKLGCFFESRVLSRLSSSELYFSYPISREELKLLLYEAHLERLLPAPQLVIAEAASLMAVEPKIDWSPAWLLAASWDALLDKPAQV